MDTVKKAGKDKYNTTHQKSDCQTKRMETVKRREKHKKIRNGYCKDMQNMKK